MKRRLWSPAPRWTHQPARYLGVAGATNCLYLALVAGGIGLGFHYMAAIVTAQVLTISLAFPAYRHWVFAPGADWGKDLARFVSVWSIGAVAGLVLTPLLVELARWHPMWAQVLALAVVAGGSYLSHRYFTFRPVLSNERPCADE